MPPTPKLRWRFATGFEERFSETFVAEKPIDLVVEAKLRLADVRCEGLRGTLTLEAESTYAHRGESFTEWRSVGPDALPVDGGKLLVALMAYKARIFAEATSPLRLHEP